MASGDEEPGPGQVAARRVGYIRIYTGADDVTRFEDLDYSAVPMTFAPPAPPVFVTTPQAAGSVMFLSFPAGWTDPGHPTPARQLVFLLSGEAIGTAGGEERRVGPGTVVMMEDTTGPGHGLTALTDLVMAVVRLGPAG